MAVGVAVADQEGGGGFVGVGEAVQLGEPDRPVGVLEVGEDAAGADRGELLVVADQAHPPAVSQGVADGGVEGGGVGHPGLVDQQQGLRVRSGRPSPATVGGGRAPR